MKKSVFVMSAVLAASVASAEDAKKPVEAPKAPAKAAEPAKPVVAAKASEVAGEIVSADAVKKTLTFKNEKGESVTWPAEGKALESLKLAKAGEKVTIAYRANEKGEPQAATEIKAMPAAKVSDAKPVAAEKK